MNGTGTRALSLGLWLLACGNSQPSTFSSTGATVQPDCIGDCGPAKTMPGDAGAMVAAPSSLETATDTQTRRSPVNQSPGVVADAGANSQQAKPVDTSTSVISDTSDDNLPVGVVSRFPRSGTSDLCSDLSLHLQFDRPVSLGNTGQIRLIAGQGAEQVILRLDLEVPPAAVQVGGRLLNRVSPVFVDANTAIVALPAGTLAPNQEYLVEVDSSVFQDENGSFLDENPQFPWTFSTGEPSKVAEQLVVDWQGAGDFCSVQGALDSIPSPNPQTVEVTVQAGTYHELIVFSGKSNITLRGEGREQTVIAYPNNENLNGGTAARAMVTAIDADDLVFENLTLHNTTPQGGGQAETLRVRGDRIVLRNSSFKSLQDTLLLDGNVYVVDSLIEGNVDFVWGRGAAYFERSEISIVGRSGVIVQSRNSVAGQGYAFVDCSITSEPGIGQSELARIDVSRFPASQVLFVDCQMAPQISPEGWTVTGTAGQSLDELEFGEFQSRDESGQLLNVSGRHPASRQLTAQQAAQVRNRAAFLNGWDPLEP